MRPYIVTLMVQEKKERGGSGLVIMYEWCDTDQRLVRGTFAATRDEAMEEVRSKRQRELIAEHQKVKVVAIGAEPPMVAADYELIAAELRRRESSEA